MINLKQIREALQDVYDPELGVNVVELGLVYDISEPAEGDLLIRMTMTTPGCPMHDNISESVEWAVLQVVGVSSVKVDVVWDPPWSPEMMSEEAKLKLGMG